MSPLQPLLGVTRVNIWPTIQEDLNLSVIGSKIEEQTEQYRMNTECQNGH